MDNEIWHRLLSLESREVVSRWFEIIHGRELNGNRCEDPTVLGGALP
jgi:hypothetical protein